MDVNYLTLILLWVLLPISLWIAVPRNRLREATATFLFFQMLSWLFSFGLTAAGMPESPFRVFMYATKITFTMEFLVYPTIGVLFQLTFPEGARFLRRSAHYLLWIGIILT